MQRCLSWSKGISAVLALVAGSALLIFAVPFAVGITRDMVGVTGTMPALIALACAIGLAASLSTRMGTR